MFSVKIVARPDARMVEVPLELEAELPREFEGQAVLASSGVPRKVKLKALKDSLKLSTAYRADLLLADLARTALRASPLEIQKVQESAQRFVRLVRERRLDGAALAIRSDGRGTLEVEESGTGPPSASKGPISKPPQLEGQAGPPGASALTERLAALERRIAQLESALPQLLEGGDGEAPAARKQGPRITLLEDKLRKAEAQQILVEQRLEALQGELRAAQADALTRWGTLQQRVDGALRVREELQAEAREDALWRGEGKPPPAHAETATPLDGRPVVRRATAVDAFADGLRTELRDRVAAALQPAAAALAKVDRAAALAAEGASSLGASKPPADALRSLSGQAAARQQALQRLLDEIDFYKAEELPVAQLLVERLEKQPAVADPIELLRQVVVSARGGADETALASWLSRSAALCGDDLQQALPGEPVLPELHDAFSGSEPRGNVVRTVAPGVRAGSRTLRRPLVETTERSPQAPATAADQATPPATATAPAAAAAAAAAAQAVPAAPASDKPAEAALLEKDAAQDEAEVVLEAEEIAEPLEEGDALPELEPISGPISGPVVVGQPGAAEQAAPPSAPKRAGDLWTDVASDDGWASIKLETPPEGADPWAAADEAAKKAEPQKPADPEPPQSK